MTKPIKEIEALPWLIHYRFLNLISTTLLASLLVIPISGHADSCDNPASNTCSVSAHTVDNGNGTYTAWCTGTVKLKTAVHDGYQPAPGCALWFYQSEDDCRSSANGSGPNSYGTRDVYFASTVESIPIGSTGTYTFKGSTGTIDSRSYDGARYVMSGVWLGGYSSAGNNCVALPPHPSCSVTNATLDYSNLAPSDYDESTAQQQVTVTCSDTADVTLDLLETDVPLSNGTKASLTINDSSKPVSINNVNGTGTQATIKSVLHGTPTIGEFSGSTVLTVSVN